MLRVENPEHLFLICLGVFVNLLPRQRFPRHVASRRVADQRGRVADEKNHRVPQLLKMPQLAHQHRVPQVQVRRSRVEPRLHAQRPSGFAALFKPLAQVAHADNLRRALFQQIHLFIYR